MTRDDIELFATILWTLAPFIVIVAVFFTACIMVAITTIKALKGDFDDIRFAPPIEASPQVPADFDTTLEPSIDNKIHDIVPAMR